MTIKAHVATIRGTFLAPGVSANGRLYTKENIGRAVSRMQAAIEDGSAPPITQLTSHGTDDVLQTVGRLTRVWQAPDGTAKYESETPDTANGRDMATLAKHGYIKNVSISGRWVGDVKKEERDGGEVETAEDLEVLRVDYVPRPGVSAARIDDVALAEGGVLGDWRDEVEAVAELAPEESELRLTIREELLNYARTNGIKWQQSLTTSGKKENPVSEKETEPKEETKGGLSESDITAIADAVSKSNADLVEKLVAAMKPAPVVEKGPEDDKPEPANPAPATAETEDERFNRLFEAKKAELVAQVVKENGLPTRQGVVASAVESRPLHEMSAQELLRASVEAADALIQPGVTYPGVHRD